MAKRNILKYCRKLIKKSRSFCAGLAAKIRGGFRAFFKKLRSFCGGAASGIRAACRAFFKRSGAVCAAAAAGGRDGCRAFFKKARSLCAAVASGIRRGWRAFSKKLKSFCAAHLNVKRADVFLIIAVVAALAYIVANHVFKAASQPERANIAISPQCAALLGRDAVSAHIREFEKLHPNLRIREAADGADIVFFDDSEFGGLMGASALVPLDPYRRSGSRAKQTTYWALPLVSFMDIFIYNIDILQAAGLDRPPKTRAEFLTAARAVAESAAGESAPFALGLSPKDPLALRRDVYPWLWANGVDIHAIDLSGGEPALPRAVLDVVAFFGQLSREGLLAPETFEKTGPQRLQEFAEGKIAMMAVSARDLLYFWDNAYDFAIGITALPAMAQGKNRLGLSSIYAGISSSSAAPDEAWVFLSFLAEKSGVFAEALGAVPGSYPDAFAGEYIERSDLLLKAWDIFEAADIVEYKPGQPSEEEINRLIREKLAEAFKGEPAPSP